MGSNGKSPERIEAERLVKAFPDTPSRTLARRLAGSMKCSVEKARSLLRVARGAAGKKSRKDNRPCVVRPQGKAGWKPEACPQSSAEPWEPFILDGAKRVGILSDIHVPYHDPKALTAAVKFLRDRKPDTVVLNGDTCDFYTLSRFDRDPRKRDFKHELETAKQCLEWIRGAFPKSRIVFKTGNHEERWDHWLWNHAPEISDLQTAKLSHLLDFEPLGIELVENQRPIMAGKLAIFHGHELPKGANPVNPARGAYLRTSHTILIGHVHRASTHSESGLWHDEVVCWSTGCLCDRRPEYARINKWDLGFADVDIHAGGEFGVNNYRISKAGKVRSS